LANLAARSLEVPAEIVLVSRFDELFTGLGNDQFDAVLSGVTRTLSRAASLAFSQPYLVSGQEVFVRDAPKFSTLESVNRPAVRLGVKVGTTGEAFARQNLANALISSFTTSDELFGAIGSGALDAVISDGLVGRDVLLRKKVPVPLSVVESRRVTTESFAIVTRQGDADWTAFLSLLVREVRSDGSFHQLAHRYNPWLRAER
jgi:polar amino acid transport system substrate-binding protein